MNKQIDDNFNNDFGGFKINLMKTNSDSTDNINNRQAFPMRKDEPLSFAQRVEQERRKS